MEVCQNPNVLRVILFISQILNMVFIIVPIGLIVMIGVDFFKNVTTSREDDMKKNLQIAIKRVIYCICIFFVPTVVQLVSHIVDTALEDTSINYVECLVNANTETIETLINEQAKLAYDTVLSEQTMAAVIEAETAINKMKDGQEQDGVSKETMLSDIDGLKQTIIAEQKGQLETEQPGTSSSSTVLTSGKYLYQLSNPDPEYSGHKVELTDTQYLSICRALYGERESSSYAIYVALAQYIRDHVDGYEAIGTKNKNYDNIGSRWLLSARGNRAGDKALSWFEENRLEIIEAVDYVFSNGVVLHRDFWSFMWISMMVVRLRLLLII